MRFKIPLYSNKKLRLAFEYGLVLKETAKVQGVEVTPELIEKAEKVIVSEFSSKSAKRVANDMALNLLAIFETN